MQFTPQYFFELSQFAHSELFATCKYVWEPLNLLKNYLAKQALGKIEIAIGEGVYLINKELISIGEGTTIEPGVLIKGPCIIGKNCEIRHGAYIRGDSIIGDNVVIGHDTEIKQSILLDKAKAPHFAFLGNCIVGNNVNLGAGTKNANLRLDHQEIVISFNATKIPTGMKKLGGIIGDNTQVGCNTVICPGTLIGKNAQIYPCICVKGCIASNSIVKSSEPVPLNSF